MCRRMTCPRCDRPTWAGCGAHVEQVLGDVPPSERCHCSTAAPAKAPASGKRPSWLQRVLGG